MQPKIENVKIAIIRKKYTFHGGAEGFSRNFIETLAHNGHEIHIFAIEWQIDKPLGDIHFHKVPAITFVSILRDLTFAVSSFFQLKKQRKYFDIIQTHDKTLYQDIYRAGDGCHIEWLRQRWGRTGFLGKLSIVSNPYHWLILALERSIFKGHRFRKIIAISEMVKKNVINNYGVSPDEIEVIYNGVNVEKFHPENRKKYKNEIRQKHGLADTDFVVLFAGSGFERKGVKFLLKAIESISAPISLMIVGKGSDKKFKTARHVQATNVQGNVIPAKAGHHVGDPTVAGIQKKGTIVFCGPQKDIHKYYASSDIFVFPTMYEPFGNVHLEALASGLPVITTKYSGAAEIIKDGVNGFVVQKPEDFESIAEKIEGVFNDREKLVSMGKNARRLAEEFTYKRHIDKILALYKGINTEKNSK